MCGMKTGAGEDPFAEDDTDDQDGTNDERRPEAGGQGKRNGDTDDEDRTGVRSETGQTPPTQRGSVASERGDASEAIGADELPFIARRNARGDNVKAGREKQRLFELRPGIAGKEAELLAELEIRLGTDVPKTDAREAALAVIYERPDLVADRLEQWGINYFDE